MKRLLSSAMLALVSAAAFGVDFAQVQPVLAKNGCQGCHAVNGYVSGPAYHAIAAKYTNKPDVRSYLSGKIRNGSSNTWGAAAMPPTEQIDDLDLKQVVEWLATGAAAPDTAQ
jgi:cytochrome c551/c552